MSAIVDVEVLPADSIGPLRADSYDYNRLPAELRDQAMLAQGTVLTKLGGAIERVIDAGNTLRWAKATLPHGEYLPWVQQACGLKPRYAQQLVRAAEWASNAQSIAHLQDTSIETLFILSADATPEDVREWVMERCAAGEPPSPKEVQEHKRQAQGKPDRTIEQQALAVLKLSPEARELAAQAVHISTRQLMDALGVEELPKGREHRTAEAVFHKNGTGWWRLPNHASPAVDVIAASVDVPQPYAAVMNTGLMPLERAASLLGMTAQHLRTRLTPGQLAKNGLLTRNGHRVERAGRGMVRLTPL